MGLRLSLGGIDIIRRRRFRGGDADGISGSPEVEVDSVDIMVLLYWGGFKEGNDGVEDKAGAEWTLIR